MASAAARQIAALSPALDGLDLPNLTEDLPPGHVEVEDLGGAQVHRLGRAALTEDSLRLLYEAGATLCQRRRPDLVHGFYAVHAGYLATLLGRAHDLPSVVSLRGNDVDCSAFQGSRAFFLQQALANASAVTGVSRPILRQATALCGRRDGLHFIPNSVDGERFGPGASDAELVRTLGELPRPWIGFAGELRFKKGLPLLLELVEALHDRQRGSLVLIGGVCDDERASLERWQRACPAAARRLLELPYQRDPARLVATYRAMDLFVFPSLWDGMPNALLEVMACAPSPSSARPWARGHGSGCWRASHRRSSRPGWRPRWRSSAEAPAAWAAVAHSATTGARVDGQLADGNRYTIGVSAALTRKKKRKRKYTKVRERLVETLSLRLRVDPEAYGETGPVLEQLQRTRPPVGLQPRALAARGQVVSAVLSGQPQLSVQGRSSRQQADAGLMITGQNALQSLLWVYHALSRARRQVA